MPNNVSGTESVLPKGLLLFTIIVAIGFVADAKKLPPFFPQSLHYDSYNQLDLHSCPSISLQLYSLKQVTLCL